MMLEAESLWLMLVWLLYFLVHSLLASLRFKRRIAELLPAFMPYYRLVFNMIALLLLVAPLYMIYADPGERIIDWSSYWQWLSYLLALSALLGFGLSLRYYDGSAFPRNSNAIYRTLQQNIQTQSDSDVMWCKDGSQFAVEYTCAPCSNPVNTTGAVLAFQDISRIKRH